MIGPYLLSLVHPIAAAGRVTAPSCSVVIESETRLTLAVKAALVEPRLAAAADVSRGRYTHRGEPATLASARTTVGQCPLSCEPSHCETCS
jgi:hypothetical protein